MRTQPDRIECFGRRTPDVYRKLNPNAKVPTLLDGELTIWELHTILRYLAATYGPQLTNTNPADPTLVERWMDWLLGALNGSFLAVFREASKPAPERYPEFATQAAELVAQLKIADGISRSAMVRARSLDHRRHRARADYQTLPRVPDRETDVR